MSRSLLAQSEESLLRTIAEGVESETGEAFYHSLVRHLATALGVTHSFISELTQGGTHFRTLAVWARGSRAPNFEVPLDGTPCESVLRGEAAFYPARVQELFPRDTGLADWSAVSYAGTPMFDSSGRVVGHVAFFHDETFEGEGPALAVMRIFAKRVVAEIERQRLEDSLIAAEERLSRVIASAADAIISFDREGRIQLFNAGAERVLRCESLEAVGSPIERFTTPAGRAALRSAVEQLDLDPGSLLFVGGSQSLQAQRADGTPFEFESSLSRTEIDGQAVYTLILRDVDERRKGEQELIRLRRHTEYLREEIAEAQGFESIVGRSSALRQALDEVKLVAHTDSTVLVRGATGTGKELLARAVHALSRRAERPLIKVNCATIPAGLVESELFGHEKGAFTGATERRVGRFELAHRGTLFLDEVGELPPEIQVKLLRALQEQEFERVGGTQTIRVDVRIIAATNRDLERAIVEGKYREDLYYRLNVFPITLPRLCERIEDVPVLADLFIERHATRIGRRITGLSEQARRRLMEYSWPGNVRELENVIERALILCQGPELEIPSELLTIPTALGPQSPPAAPASEQGQPPMASEAPASLEEVERHHIRAILEAARWKIEGRQGAATRLGLAPSTLRSRMRKLGIERTSPG
ncbi:MAG: sigma 54-interacting transcriptional regulator [Polyangiales bacterium]